LAALGEADRCREWIRRAMLIDPDNILMRYNFACALCRYLKDLNGALDLLAPYTAKVLRSDIEWMKVDPDLDLLRDDPRFKAMLAEADARVSVEAGAPS
jgi:adenylate cyclase